MANVTYHYGSNYHGYPIQVMSYQLVHNPYGELISVTLPSGLVYSFQKVPLLGNSLVKYLPPWGNKRSLTYLLDGSETKKDLPEPFPQSIFLLKKEAFQTFITKGDFIYTTKKDEYGRLKLKSLSLNGRPEKMHQQSFEYGERTNWNYYDIIQDGFIPDVLKFNCVFGKNQKLYNQVQTKY